ncbi:methyltransferase domain-containing protein [Mycobacterium basiliense]|uniref:class I SAM-dependent methyltransferase n=1 Tax=Mycobacterium basiliense TaxID=2094119 RepID=UPI001301078C
MTSPTERIPRLRDLGLFLRCALTSPGRTGAVLPSSRALARSMTSVLSEFSDPNVLELGPGTGPMTHYIQRRLAGAGRHVAVELNPAFAQRLAERYPRVDVVCDTAAALPRILEARGMYHVDAVITSLPFSLIPDDVQTDIMDGITSLINPECGVFTTINYVGAFSTPRARRFRALLRERFDQLVVSRPVLGNMPPAYILTARRAHLAR